MYFVPRLSYGDMKQEDTPEVIIRRSAADKKARAELAAVFEKKYTLKPKTMPLKRPFKAKWEKLTAEQFAAIAVDITLYLVGIADKEPWPMIHTNFTAYATRLGCHYNSLFIDVVMEKMNAPGQFGQTSTLVSDERVLPLSTEMNAISAWNFVHGRRMNTLETVSEYLRLVCWVLSSDTGPFQVIEDTSFAQLPSGKIKINHKPRKISGHIQGEDWIMRATILHVGKLHDVEIHIDSSGQMLMQDDKMVEDLSDQLPVWDIRPHIRYIKERKT